MGLAADVRTEDLVVEVAGASLAVRRFHPPSAAPSSRPALVFLHEGLGSIDVWGRFPRDLVAASRHVGVAYDRRGHGASDPLDAPRDVDYLHHHALDELPAVLRALEISRPVLVGHSDGGTIALLHAAFHPTSAVVALAAHVFVEEAALDGIRRTVTRWRSGDLGPRLERYHGEKTADVFSAWADTWLAPWFRSWDITAVLPRITCPCLLVQGEDDRYATAGHLEAIASRVGGPVTSHLLTDCGHAPHRDRRGTVIDLAGRVLEQLGTSSELR